jgi:hypothetical protein
VVGAYPEVDKSSPHSHSLIMITVSISACLRLNIPNSNVPSHLETNKLQEYSFFLSFFLPFFLSFFLSLPYYVNSSTVQFYFGPCLLRRLRNILKANYKISLSKHAKINKYTQKRNNIICFI